MKSFTTLAAAGVAIAAPFSFPLKNGFPNLSPAALSQVEMEAGGALPNGGLPTGLSKGIQTSFQLIAANEIFEVAYFTSLLHNITHNVPGYECTEEDRGFVEKAVARIRAQEELHAAGANAILSANNAQTVGPCKYQFPVTNFQNAIALANTFTDVVLGVLPVVQLQGGQAHSAGGDALIPLIGSIEEQEAEQVGWFRVLQSKLPSAAPFLTSTTPEFALSAVSQFLVPGSCPPEYAALESAIKSFPPLSVTTPPQTGCTTVSYSVPGDIPSGAVLAYLSGQTLPVTVAITNIQKKGATTTFDAAFPAANNGLADGLIIAAVVSKNATYSSAADVAASTVYGPGLIEYN